MKGLCLRLVIVFCLAAGLLPAQTVAVYFDIPGRHLPAAGKSYVEFKDLLRNKMQIQSWGYIMEDRQLQLDTFYRKEEDQVAAQYLLSIFLKINEEYEPPLNTVKDTISNTITTHFFLRAKTEYYYVLTHLRSREILHVSGDVSGESIGKTFEVKWKEYFKNIEPEVVQKKDPKKYKETLKKIHADFRKEFEKYFIESRPYDLLYNLGDAVVSPFVKEPRPIEEPVLSKGKLESFHCTAPEGLAYFKGMRTTVFSLDTIDHFIVPTNYFHWIIEDAGPEKCRLETKFLIKSKNKEAGEAHASGKMLYYMPGFIPFSRNLKQEERIVIGIRNMSKLRALSIAGFLSKSPSVRVINTMEEDVILALQERFKHIRFVESAYSAAALGARYIISSTNSDYVLQDAQSGTTLGNSLLKRGSRGVFDLLQKSLDLKVSIIKILKSRKDALNEALVYSPLGLNDFMSFELVRQTPENVGGKTIMREIGIGQGNIVKADDWGYIYGIARINKGEKEAFAAYRDNLPLLFLQR